MINAPGHKSMVNGSQNKTFKKVMYTKQNSVCNMQPEIILTLGHRVEVAEF
jgi:hypothetical protein